MNCSAGRLARITAALAALLMVLAGCGGGAGGDGGPTAAAAMSVTSSGTAQGTTSVDALMSGVPQQDPQAAQAGPLPATFAAAGFNWINVRRQQVGLSPLTRNTVIDSAALGHSEYQRLNDTITHEQTPGKPGFTGARPRDRLKAAGFTFLQSSLSYGEVISATTDGSGVQAAEDLIGAIYHRYAIFEPMFREAGAGAATVPDGYTYFTVNFAADGLRPGIGRGSVVTYPIANQQDVERMVFSDREAPDPVPGQDIVGYPISVHANIISELTVQGFSVSPQGGAALPARLQTSAADPETPPSAAAIIPMQALAPATVYEVKFNGTVDGVPVSLAWSFRTR